MSKKRGDPDVGHDILKKYLVGGVRNRHKLLKEGRGRSESTKLSRIYVAIPPPSGWPGGAPEQNGYRPGGKK